MDKSREAYTTVSSGMRGFYAVLMTWDEECNTHTPLNTGFGSYETSESARKEAQEWAEAEGIKCI